MDERIAFTTEDNEQVFFYVVEETTLNGNLYLLVTEDNNAEEAEAYIMKQINDNDSDEVTYVMVEDDTEMEAVAGIFDELLEEVDVVNPRD